MWSQSTFPFESNIGELKRSFNCTVDVVEQIAFNFSIKATLENTIENNHEDAPKILRLKRKELSLEQKRMLEVTDAGIKAEINYEIGNEMIWKKRVYKSMVSVITKSIDYFIQLTDGTIGAIEYFIQMENRTLF